MGEAVFPKGTEPAAVVNAAQSQHVFGAGFAPEHARLFTARADDGFAARLKYSRLHGKPRRARIEAENHLTLPLFAIFVQWFSSVFRHFPPFSPLFHSTFFLAGQASADELPVPAAGPAIVGGPGRLSSFPLVKTAAC